ncbi:MAG TPA: histidine ammonia-lyase [Candidatus Acidoferrales bacterium]|nr:histidine ammonia-lyase [Candidatus Acidoferrales bacterium]
MTIELTGNDLNVAQFSRVVFDREPAALAAAARAAMERSRAVVDKFAAGDAVVYGVTTGFGDLAQVKIPTDQLRAVQLNLLRSHASGVGEPLSETESRATLLLRANVLAKGFSGTRVVIVERLCQMLDHGVHPVIPSRGSVGASGGLAPLSHLALVLLGEGEAYVNGVRVSGGDALRRAGIEPVQLEAKEGLSLINGTQPSLAVGLLALLEAENLVETADVAAGLSLDALRGTPMAFDERIHRLRPFSGQLRTAANLRRLNEGSEIRQSHIDCPRVQDAYSLRCTPQVHGAVRDALAYVRGIFETELNAGTDNPLVFAEQDEVVSGGNFHGQPLALALDVLGIALVQLGNISERRAERLVNPALSGLPPFLTRQPGVNSGFMMAQVTAAALASENKGLAHPASVDSIPTSSNEDFVSMSMGAALKTRQIVDNVRTILAVELLCACQGIDLLAPLKTGHLAAQALAAVRRVVPTLEQDRILAPDIEAVRQLISQRTFQELLTS